MCESQRVCVCVSGAAEVLLPLRLGLQKEAIEAREGAEGRREGEWEGGREGE